MNVSIYSTPTCPYCKMAKEFLTQHNIAFENIDVSADEKRADEMVAKSGQRGVPVIVITKDDGQEEVIIGFDKARLKSVLGL